MLHLHETPVSMRVRSTRPFLTMRLGQGKVNRKSPFSTNFLRKIMPILPIFARFHPVSGFCPPGRHRRAVQRRRESPLIQPKRTFFPGREGCGDGRIQRVHHGRQQLEMLMTSAQSWIRALIPRAAWCSGPIAFA